MIIPGISPVIHEGGGISPQENVTDLARQNDDPVFQKPLLSGEVARFEFQKVGLFGFFFGFRGSETMFWDFRNGFFQCEMVGDICPEPAINQRISGTIMQVKWGNIYTKEI